MDFFKRTPPAPKAQVLTLDPVAMNIVNRLAPGTTQVGGDVDCAGGMLIQGTKLGGKLTISDGPLVVLAGGTLTGEVHVNGDAYIFGTLGQAQDPGSKVYVQGTIYLADTAEVYGSINCNVPVLYSGARLQATIHSRLDARPASS